MTTLTITVNGNKAGELIYFVLNVPKSNFLNVVQMTWDSVEDVLAGQKQGHYAIL